jgi:hypothetical protein
VGHAIPEEVLSRALYVTQFTRQIDRHGYIRFKHWRFFGENGLVGEEVSVWVYEDTRDPWSTRRPPSRCIRFACLLISGRSPKSRMLDAWKRIFVVHNWTTGLSLIPNGCLLCDDQSQPHVRNQARSSPQRRSSSCQNLAQLDSVRERQVRRCSSLADRGRAIPQWGHCFASRLSPARSPPCPRNVFVKDEPTHDDG